MYRAIGSAADLSQVLDALVDGVGYLFPRAALFVVKTKSKRLQGWRSVGFTGVAAITREFEFPLTTDSALTRAVTASRTIFTGEGQSAAQSTEAWTVTFPVTTGGRVVAVVHADGGARPGDPVAAFDRDTALDLGHTLVRMAGERIGASHDVCARRLRQRHQRGSGRDDAGPRGARLRAAADCAHRRQRCARQRDVVTGTSTVQKPEPQIAVVPRRRLSPLPTPPSASPRISEISRYSQAAAPAPAARSASRNGSRNRLRVRAPRRPRPRRRRPASALGLFDEALGKMLGNSSLDQAPAAVRRSDVCEAAKG